MVMDTSAVIAIFAGEPDGPAHGAAIAGAAFAAMSAVSYALAKQRREPLLFKGNDFSQTDLVPALTFTPACA